MKRINQKYIFIKYKKSLKTDYLLGFPTNENFFEKCENFRSHFANFIAKFWQKNSQKCKNFPKILGKCENIFVKLLQLFFKILYFLRNFCVCFIFCKISHFFEKILHFFGSISHFSRANVMQKWIKKVAQIPSIKHKLIHIVHFFQHFLGTFCRKLSCILDSNLLIGPICFYLNRTHLFLS